MKNTLIFLGLLVLIGCKEEKIEAEDLIGHWHINREMLDSSVINHAHFTIDIYEDSSARLDRFDFWNGQPGLVFYDQKVLHFGIECFHRSYQFSLRNEKLDLRETVWVRDIQKPSIRDLLSSSKNEESVEENEEFGESPVAVYEEDYIPIYKHRYFTATKHDINLCDKQKAYFRDLIIDIDLPVSSLEGLDTFTDFDIEINFAFGIPKEEKQEELGKEYISLLQHIPFTIDSLINGEGIFSYYREEDLFNVHLTFYADQQTPISKIYPVLDFYKQKGRPIVYFALRKADVFKSLEIRYKKIDTRLIKWEEVMDLKFGEWIENI